MKTDERGIHVPRPWLPDFAAAPEVAPRNGGVRHDAASPRRLTPELCFIRRPETRGRREGRVQAAPMARQQIKKLAAVTTGLADIRPSLRDGATAYSALSSGTGLSCPRRRAIISRDLTSASGGQDHTPSPSALASFVRVHKARAMPTRPSHPAPNVRDDREAPLLSERGTTRIMLLIIGKVKFDSENQQADHCDRMTRRAVCAWSMRGAPMPAFVVRSPSTSRVGLPALI